MVGLCLISLRFCTETLCAPKKTSFFVLHACSHVLHVCFLVFWSHSLLFCMLGGRKISLSLVLSLYAFWFSVSLSTTLSGSLCLSLRFLVLCVRASAVFSHMSTAQHGRQKRNAEALSARRRCTRDCGEDAIDRS